MNKLKNVFSDHSDFDHLMELESHTTRREETTPTSHIWGRDSSVGLKVKGQRSSDRVSSV